jgi:hypothetical protein
MPGFRPNTAPGTSLLFLRTGFAMQKSTLWHLVAAKPQAARSWLTPPSRAWHAMKISHSRQPPLQLPISCNVSEKPAVTIRTPTMDFRRRKHPLSEEH